MSDIFLCYSRKDGAIAGELRERLQAQGWTVFMDLHIDAGDRWSEEIERELQAARAVLTLWSASSVCSRFVMDEAHDAAERGVIFPARIEQVRIPYGFRQFQTPDLIGWNGDGDREEWQRLVAALRKHLGEEAAAPDEIGAIREQGTKQPRTARTATVDDHQSDRSTTAATPVIKTHLAAAQPFRDKLKIGGEGPLMVVIPAGRFLMGSPPKEPKPFDDEGPQHEVHIARPFAMGVYAVTFEEYDRFCEATKQDRPDDRGWGRGDRPVMNVSWNDAQAYCSWLSAQTGRGYRLPSEAEWEYACRAGTTTPFHFGERISTDQANFNGNYTYNGSAKGEYRETTTPVGSFPPNAFGLYDMHGNVWEWCQDAWHRNYAGAPGDGSAWDAKGDVSRVVRGGSWGHDPGHCRAAYRDYSGPGSRGEGLGFRVCCSSPIE